MKKINKKGFTIVELVIVIAVIAILAAVLIPTFSGVVEKANQSSAMQAAKNAYTEYLVEETSNVTTKHDLIIDTGKYYATVTNNQFDSASITKDDAVGTATLTPITNGSASNNTFKINGGHYDKVANGTTIPSESNTYFNLTPATTANLTDYVYYGTFNGCDVYVK